MKPVNHVRLVRKLAAGLRWGTLCGSPFVKTSNVGIGDALRMSPAALAESVRCARCRQLVTAMVAEEAAS